MLFAGTACLAVTACDDSDAELSPVAAVYFTETTSDTDPISSVSEITDKSISVIMRFRESACVSGSSLTVNYTAKLVDGRGNTISNALNSTSGEITNFSSATGTGHVKFTINNNTTLDAGDYRLEVTVTETGTLGGKDIGENKISNSLKVHIVEPITFTVTLKNIGETSISDMGYSFYLDGKKLEDSSGTVTIEKKDGTKDVTYTTTYDEYKTITPGKHTFYVAADGDYLVSGLGEENAHTFYMGQDSYDYMNYVMGAILVLVIVLLIWVCRRPVKNYGKPKARR